MDLSNQVRDLFLLPMAIACISWTVTHEEVFKEPREYCIRKSKRCKKFLERKFFYLFTCEYCFSHYVTILFLFITGYHLLLADWRGYLIGGLSLILNYKIKKKLFDFIRVKMKKEKLEITIKEKELNSE